MGLQSSNFAYTLEEPAYHGPGYLLHQSVHKQNGGQYSVFVFDTSNGSGLNAKRFIDSYLLRLKTCRQPNLLKFYDSVEENNKLYIVTERVVPFTDLLWDVKQNTNVMEWGIHQILSATSFLNDQGFVHGNIGSHSIFINNGGDWRLAGFQTLTEFSKVKNRSGLYIDGLPYVYQNAVPPEIKNSQSLSNINPHSIDSWGVAIFIAELFCGQKDVDIVKMAEYIPKKFVSKWKKLLRNDPSNRLSSSQFLAEVRFNNPIIEVCVFLDEFAVKEQNEIDLFFRKLPSLIEYIPMDICKYKILPRLTEAIDFGSTDKDIITLVFNIAKDLDDSEYDKLVLPAVIRWFNSKDLMVRSALLENLEIYAKNIPSNILNKDIFPLFAAGFVDSSPNIRFLTVTSVIHIVPKLSSKTVNNNLLKFLANLQADRQHGIRANTTICITNLAEHLERKTRDKVLVPAFTRALKDSFPQSRQAAIQGLIHTKSLFTINQIARGIMPALAPLTVDPVREVRSDCIKALKDFVQIVEDLQDTIVDTPTEQKDVGVLGWAVQSISKIYVGEEAKTGTGNPIPGNDTISRTPSSDKAKIPPTTNVYTETPEEVEEDYSDSYEDAWNQPPPVKAPPLHTNNTNRNPNEFVRHPVRTNFVQPAPDSSPLKLGGNKTSQWDDGWDDEWGDNFFDDAATVDLPSLGSLRKRN
eukprot:TRINITY_DN2485_c0_g1_i1.p1 TRINITY_DN2485_c0_g1~~TRINITY_DN2485_c0_g1_i1.p1  ORF type:complete len:693 (-),score=137.25 TRINITY_DN2485_c0_g1_i1:1312-3390(-)